MSTLSSIKRLHAVIDANLFTTTGNLDYPQLVTACLKFCNAVAEYEGDNDDMWYIGESGNCAVVDMIPGIYWHASEWHEGQSSDTYKMLCAAMEVFDPNCSMGPEEGSGEMNAYNALNDMAKAYHG